ncbi:DUF4367 domain-containing protein [Lachnospiraceae bacterium MD329]|nr:DUF4367 domain-containing protein [Lachnospiraceae bacterium MD329]
MNGNNDDIFEKAFEEMLKEAAKRADKRLGGQLEEPKEEIVFSEEHERKVEKLFRLERRKRINKKLIKYTKRCACILIVCCVAVTAVGVVKVDALRTRFLRLLYEPDAPNSDIDFIGDKTNYYADDYIHISYIPDGFKMTESSHEVGVGYTFQNNNQYFTLDANNIETAGFNVDTEDMEIENLKIQNNDAIYLTKPRVNILVWSDDDTAYVLCGNISKEDIIKIAENIRY